MVMCLRRALDQKELIPVEVKARLMKVASRSLECEKSRNDAMIERETRKVRGWNRC